MKYKSLPLSLKYLGVSLTIFVIIVVTELFYKNPLFDCSTSSDGISKLQEKDSPILNLSFWKTYSSFGGGNEEIVLVIVAFIFGSRPKFHYYLAAQALDKTILSLMKLIYHDPRPYFVIDSDNISIVGCSKEFGNPSGHSYSSSMVFIMLYLDLFHGEKVTKAEI